MTSHKPTVLITGATGQIGGDTLRNLQADESITLVAAVRSHAKAQPFAAQGIRTVIMDFDQEHTLAPALEGGAPAGGSERARQLFLQTGLPEVYSLYRRVKG